MNPDPALYRPDGDAVADLCADLRAAGLIDRGPDAELRLRAAFARLDPMPAERLAGVVRAICRRDADPARRQALDEVTGDWIARLSPAVEPLARPAIGGTAPIAAPAVEPADDGSRIGRAAAFAAVGLILLAALWAAIGPGEPPPAIDATVDAMLADVGAPDAGPDAISDAISDAMPDAGDGMPSDATADISADGTADPSSDAEPDAEIRPAPRPTYAGFTEPMPSPWPAPWALIGLLILLAAAGAIARLARDLEPIPRPLRRLLTRDQDRQPPRPLPSALYAPPRMLPKDAERRLAGSDQRATVDPTSRALDIRASVKATAARDGRVPVVRYRPLRRPEPLNLWIDWAARARTPTLARTVDELVATLKRTGLAHTRLRFIDSPAVLVDAGQRIVLDALPLNRRSTRVAVVTDGHGLMRLEAARARRLGAHLGRIDHLAVFVFGELDPQRLDGHLGLVGRVHRDDQLLPWIADRAPGRPRPFDPTLLRTWAAACALAPSGASDTDALALAEHLGFGIPSSAIEALRADCGGARLEWPTARRAALIDALSNTAPDRRDAAVAWWRSRYPTEVPETPAQWVLERLSLGLWTADIARVVETAEALDGLRLDTDARRLLAAFAPADVLPDAPLMHLPWAWSDLKSPRARRQLNRLGLAGGRLPRPPGRRFILLGLASGLACAAAGGALTAPRYESAVEAPCVLTLPAADHHSAEVWRCGTIAATRPDHPSWPTHSAVTLFDRPDDPDAAELALALLDVGAADSVWWSALPPTEAADQRIAVVRGGPDCPPEATACVRAADWAGLARRLGREVRPLVEVWPGVEGGGGWLAGAILARDGGVDSPENGTPDASSDAESAVEPVHGTARDAEPSGIALTGVEVMDRGPENFALKVTHADRAPVERPAIRTTYRNGLLLVTVDGARWPFVRYVVPVDDDDVTVVEARGPNQLWLRPTRPPRSLVPTIRPSRRGVIVSIERDVLRPAPDTGPTEHHEDAAPLDAGTTTESEGKGSAEAGARSFRRLASTRYRPALVRIRPGQFIMGSSHEDEGKHRVKLTRGFLMGETEVTQAQYGAVMKRNPSRFQGTEADASRPVEQVSWLDAVEYCNTLSKTEGLQPAYVIAGANVTWDRESAGYRLPTESEWEYAARAFRKTATYAGDPEFLGSNDAPLLDAIAWYGGNSGSSQPEAIDSSSWPEKQYPHEKASTHPVKGKRPNGWGLYDMLGNVWEWTWDRYGDYPTSLDGAPQVDPAGPPHGARRVFRGGSFFNYAHRVSASIRYKDGQYFRDWDLGFRPVRFVGPPHGAR